MVHLKVLPRIGDLRTRPTPPTGKRKVKVNVCVWPVRRLGNEESELGMEYERILHITEGKTYGVLSSPLLSRMKELVTEPVIQVTETEYLEES